MKKGLQKIILTLVAGAVLLSSTACNNGSSSSGGGSTDSAAKKQYFTFAAPPSSSALYPYWVAVGKAISTACPEYNISVSESQGAVDIAKRVSDGQVQVGNSVASTDYECYNGKGAFDGKPFDQLRILWYYEMTANQMVVSQDSGIKTLSDLNGKKFNPGGTGTSAEQLTKDVMDVMGIEPNYFEAGQSDAAEAYSSRQVVGTVKFGTINDSYIMQLAAARPINLINFSDDEMKKIMTAYPYLQPVKIPANTYTGVDYDVQTPGCMMGSQTTSNLSQEDGYKMIKAMCEGGKEVWQAAYPSGADNDILALSLKSSIPLAAGTVQYLKEKGYDVPQNLIPPEYKDQGTSSK